MSRPNMKANVKQLQDSVDACEWVCFENQSMNSVPVHSLL